MAGRIQLVAYTVLNTSYAGGSADVDGRYFMVYNFVKIHKSIKTTPAMEAGVTDFLSSMEDIVMMSETMGQ